MSTPTYNMSPSPFQVVPNEDHDAQYHQIVTSPLQVVPCEVHAHHHQIVTPNLQASTSSSISCRLFFDSNPDQSSYYHNESHRPRQQGVGDNYTSNVGSHDLDNKIGNALKLTIRRKEEKLAHDDDENEKIPIKWMPSKMRMMQKMKNSSRLKVEDDQRQPSSSDCSSNSSSINNNTLIRVCADCNTTKTPLWRSGPKGPKSLCNACGIRQRKARRALALAVSVAGGATTHANTPPPAKAKTKVQHKDKMIINHHNTTAPFKKRFKFAPEAGPSKKTEPKKPGFEDFLINLSNNLAVSRVFPQDEKEAAILLMALSCGLVLG